MQNRYSAIVLLLLLSFAAHFGYGQTVYTAGGGTIARASGGVAETTCFPISVDNNNVPLDGTNGLGEVCVRMNHTRFQELVVYLSSPSGAFVPLIWSGNGGGNGTFCFNDNASTNLTGSTPGTYTPEFPLSTMNDGQTGTGIWELCVINYGTRTGTVNSFTITLGGPNVNSPSVQHGNNACEKVGCSFNYYDSGGPTYGYVASEAAIETFCPPVDGMCTRITFNSYDIESSFLGCYDFLEVWDGNEYGAPSTLMATICGTSGGGVSYTSTTGCLTMGFASDGSVNRAGWDAVIDCVPCAAAVESARPANDDCVNAIPLVASGTNADAQGCDLDAPMPWITDSCSWFSTENSVFYTVSVTPSTPQPVQIELVGVSCTGGANELQMALFDADCGDVGLYGSNFHGCAAGLDTVRLTANTNPLPTGNYLVVIDGNAGSDCTWDVQSALLSVEWVDLDGYFVTDEQEVKLAWSTMNEINNAGFIVQRSTDRQSWLSLDHIEPIHSSETIKNYSYSDPINENQDRFFYRLKQMDVDGKTSYSNIIEVKIRDWADEELISQYPNPAKDDFTLEIYSKGPASPQLTLVNTLGQVVYEQSWDLSTGGEHKLRSDLSRVDEGLYHYYLKIGMETFGGKVFVNR